MSSQTLTLSDTRSQHSYQIPVSDGAITALHLRQIKTDPQDFGLMSYDPGFANTASCRSSITEVDSQQGIMRYRGYPIRDLADQASFLEVAYLLVYGELPTAAALQQWRADVQAESMVHENILRFLRGFRYDAHPMSVLSATVAALSTFYHDARDIQDAAVDRHTRRLIAKMPTLAAYAFRRATGLPFVYADARLSYAGNLLNMMFKMTELEYTPDPMAERALNMLFILHADHAQNCSTATMRMVGSSLTDPYTAMSAAMSALFGQRHGGAGEAVVRMLQEIGSAEGIPAFLASVKAGKQRLAGFGHRIYKTYDPRARLIKNLAQEIVLSRGDPALLELALTLEEAALADPYFHDRYLYPNVDYYCGFVYQALGIPPSMFTVMFAVPRTAGWLAHWREKLHDPDQRIARPRQIYVGTGPRDYMPLAERQTHPPASFPAPELAQGSLIVTMPDTSYRLPIREGAVPATAWRQIKAQGNKGIVVYDPSFCNTATCRSSITFVDGERGIMRIRGYAIGQLVNQSNFLETAYLLIHGELPTADAYARWTSEIREQSLVHEKVRVFLDGFRHDAHPMGILIGTLSGLSAFYPEARQVTDPDIVAVQVRRLIAQMPTLAAFAYRHARGFPTIYPNPDRSYTGNFLSMMFSRTQLDAPPHLALERALDKLFILQADHEQATSTTSMRTVGSALANPYSCVAAAASALHGPRHGGAAELALSTFSRIGDVKNVPAYIEQVKRGEQLLMGFGHRIYKSYDPRAAAVKAIAYEVFAVTGQNPLLDIALELERIALEDDYFAERRLYPNIDFYTGCIYQAIGIPPTMFSVMFAIPRTAGWLAQWLEMLADPEQRIVHPHQIYQGPGERRYLPLDQR